MSSAQQRLTNQLRFRYDIDSMPSTSGLGRRRPGRPKGSGKRSYKQPIKPHYEYLDPIYYKESDVNKDYYVPVKSQKLIAKKVPAYTPDGQLVYTYKKANPQKNLQTNPVPAAKFNPFTGEYIYVDNAKIAKKDNSMEKLIEVALQKYTGVLTEAEAKKMLLGEGRRHHRRTGHGLLLANGRRHHKARTGRGANVGGTSRRKRPLTAYQKHMKHHMGHGMAMEDAAALWSGQGRRHHKPRSGRGLVLANGRRHHKPRSGRGALVGGTSRRKTHRRGRGNMSEDEMQRYISSLARESY